MLVNVKPLMLVGGIKIALDIKARFQPEHGTAERWRYVTLFILGLNYSPSDDCNPYGN